MYIIEYIQQENISNIMMEWHFLERGEEMTYFQTYEWYEMLIKFTPRCKAIDSVYALVRDVNGVPMMIAPLWIVKYDYRYVNKCGVYFIGRKDCTDYLNFIYKEFIPGVCDFLLKSLYEKYALKRYCFEQILESTSSYTYLIHQGNKIREEVCAHLVLPDSFERYKDLLSKNTRKNLRLAYNRLKTDGKDIKVVCDDENADMERCSYIRNARLRKKNSYQVSFLNKIKSYIYKKLAISFPECVQHQEDKNAHILSVYCDGLLQMFFCYGIDALHRKVVLMTAGVEEQFARYSLGVIGLYEFIQYLIEQGKIDEIDFLRGGEHYKYALGGVNHTIADVEIILN